MKAAGLTHGGFYGHFESKDDLIAETLAHVLLDGGVDERDLATYATDYLSSAHRDNLARGCPTAGMGAETIRQSSEARAAMTAGLRHQIERLSATAPGQAEAEKRRAAIGSWSAMLGAMILARMCDDAKLSDEVLTQTRKWMAERGVAARR
jgi:TetR/AcrR family transcriptional regulator, transcriptional repressor for nem operon